MKTKQLKEISKHKDTKIFLVGQTWWQTLPHKIYASGQ